MSESDLRTAWMWATEHGTFGLGIDREAQILHWYDEAGCACGESVADQPLADFLKFGVPGLLPELPADIVDEIMVTTHRLGQRGESD